MVALIPVFFNRKVVAWARVDDEDADRVRGLGKWSLHEESYARNRKMYMHRFVLELGKRFPQVDHRDGDGLNNVRSNLRLATNAQNHQNRITQQGATSQYRGVSWHKGGNKWEAHATLNYKNYYLGLFDDEQMAADVVRHWREEHMPFSSDATGGDDSAKSFAPTGGY